MLRDAEGRPAMLLPTCRLPGASVVYTAAAIVEGADACLERISAFSGSVSTTESLPSAVRIPLVWI
jgi:hypothetical protein